MIKLKIDWKIIALSVSLLAILGLLLKQKITNSSNISSLNQRLMTANLKIGKAKTSFGNAMALAKKKADKRILKEIKKNNDWITRYGELEASYQVLKEEKVKVRIVYRTKTIDVPSSLNLDPGQLYQTEVEDASKLNLIDKIVSNLNDFRIDIGCILTSRNKKTEMNIKYKLHLRIKGQIIETVHKTGAISYYIKLYELDDKNKEIGELNVTKFNVVIEIGRAHV